MARLQTFGPKPTAPPRAVERPPKPLQPPCIPQPTTSLHHPQLLFTTVRPKLSPSSSTSHFWPKSRRPASRHQMDPATAASSPAHYHHCRCFLIYTLSHTVTISFSLVCRFLTPGFSFFLSHLLAEPCWLIIYSVLHVNIVW